jgi:hypothetical protein
MLSKILIGIDKTVVQRILGEIMMGKIKVK